MKLKGLHIEFKLDRTVEVTPLYWGKGGKTITKGTEKELAPDASVAIKELARKWMEAL